MDLNVDNPLGKGGEMATAFGSLLHKIWRGDVDYVNPEGFKNNLGKHAVQFQSYDQHDSQEFLSYLLDMLHEDLNRVKKKPYIEEADDEGRPDEEVAEESWDTYRCVPRFFALCVELAGSAPSPCWGSTACSSESRCCSAVDLHGPAILHRCPQVCTGLRTVGPLIIVAH